MATLERVKSARSERTCEKCKATIAKGEPYTWFKVGFRSKHKRVRCSRPQCQPKESELISSPFLSQAARIREDLQEAIDAFSQNGGSPEDLKSAVEDAAGSFRELGEEAQGSFDNMPEGLQQGETGQMLEQRAQRCEEIADELEGVDFDSAEHDFDSLRSDLEEGKVKEVGDALQEEQDPEESHNDWQARLRDELDEQEQAWRDELVSNVEGVDCDVE